MRHFLTLQNLSDAELKYIIDFGIEIKENPAKFKKQLEGKKIALLFQKTSTRTRCSFEIGMYELGGYAMYLDWKTTNFTLAALEDEIKVLSKYVDVIMARVYRHEDLLTMAKNSEAPIINGLCNLYHPCQGLADFMTIKEHKGKLEGLKLAYLGDGNNVCDSLIIGATKLGIPITVGSPKGYEPKEEIVKLGRERGEVKVTNDPYEAAKDADALYTDTWVSMGQESEKEERMKIFPPYQINKELYEKSCPNALVMHCLPAHRGYEITGEMIKHPNSVIFEQTENRKHAQKALLIWLFQQNNLM